MRRPDLFASSDGTAAPTCSDASLVKKYPTLCQYMTDDKWDDGKEREPSALSVTIRDGAVMLALNDKDLKQSLYTQAATLVEAMGLMDGALQGGKGVWRAWKSGKKK